MPVPPVVPSVLPQVYRVARLLPADRELASALFAMMATVFGEGERSALAPEYVERLLAREDLWVLAAVAIASNEPVGGLTAHVLPMTSSETSEVFIYDLAVREDHQRRGVGRLLIRHAQELAAAAEIADLFVPADVEDEHALEFYKALGGSASAVSLFGFRGADTPR